MCAFGVDQGRRCRAPPPPAAVARRTRSRASRRSASAAENAPSRALRRPASARRRQKRPVARFQSEQPARRPGAFRRHFAGLASQQDRRRDVAAPLRQPDQPSQPDQRGVRPVAKTLVFGLRAPVIAGEFGRFGGGQMRQGGLAHLFGLAGVPERHDALLGRDGRQRPHQRRITLGAPPLPPEAVDQMRRCVHNPPQPPQQNQHPRQDQDDEDQHARAKSRSARSAIASDTEPGCCASHTAATTRIASCRKNHRALIIGRA